MKLNKLGMVCEVVDGDRVMFVGNCYACEEYMNNHQLMTYNERGNSITRQGLKVYFELVEDMSNWKNGVSRAIGDLTNYEEKMISIAVMFFTGSVAKWSYKNGKRWIEFDGL